MTKHVQCYQRMPDAKLAKANLPQSMGPDKRQTMSLPKHCIPCCFPGPGNSKTKLVQSQWRAGDKAWPQQATNCQDPKALHVLLSARTQKHQGKASVMLVALARCKASKSQPATKHLPQQATNHDALKAMHALLFCRTGKAQGKASAKLASRSKHLSPWSTSIKLSKT